MSRHHRHATQQTLSLALDSEADFSHLVCRVAIYHDACLEHSKVNAALAEINADPAADYDTSLKGRMNALDALHRVYQASESLREALYSVEHGQPGRNVWKGQTLEDFDAVVDRAQQVILMAGDHSGHEGR